jgi:hypothetical protein
MYSSGAGAGAGDGDGDGNGGRFTETLKKPD